MVPTIRCAAVGLLLALPFPAAAGGIELPPGDLGNNFSGVGFNAVKGKPRFIIFVLPHEIEGMLAVCGAVVVDTTNGTARRAEKQVTRNLGYELLGQPGRFRTADLIRYEGMDAADASDKVGRSVTRRPRQAACATAKIEFPGGPVMFNECQSG